MEKQNVIYSYNGIFLAILKKKGQRADSYYNMDELWKQYTEWKKLVTENYYHMISIIWKPSLGTFIDTEIWVVIT